MKRRSFLQLLAGVVGVSVTPLPKASLPAPSGELFSGIDGDAVLTGNEEALTFYEQPLVIDQMRGISLREQHKADLARWLADEFDRKTLEALTGKNSRA